MNRTVRRLLKEKDQAEMDAKFQDNKDRDEGEDRQIVKKKNMFDFGDDFIMDNN